ncbi:MAG: hypothetical protein ACT4P7_22320 [Gemmatimonadaceae bacterium]
MADHFPVSVTMQSNRLGRTLALGVIAVAVFSTLAALSLPVQERRPEVSITAVVAVLLLCQAVFYWWGDRVRGRVGMVG